MGVISQSNEYLTNITKTCLFIKGGGLKQSINHLPDIGYNSILNNLTYEKRKPCQFMIFNVIDAGISKSYYAKSAIPPLRNVQPVNMTLFQSNFLRLLFS